VPVRALSPRRRASDRATGFVDLLADDYLRPGIAGTAYDTAWLAAVPAPGGAEASRFPAALEWLGEHQRPDGSWGGEVRYEHDRILCTLAALAPLAAYGRRRSDRVRVAAGTRYLWKHGHLMAHESVELVGFELLLPTLVQRARQAGVIVPPHLDIYQAQRAEKLRLIPPELLYSSRATVVHSLEFLGDEADPGGLQGAQGGNGAIGNSPAATAFFLTKCNDPRALAYLQECLRRSGGATAPVLHPCETFELLWAAYHLFLAGVPARRLLTVAERAALRRMLDEAGGVSLSPTFPIPDADDTAVALLLLHEVGEPVDVGLLQAFASPDGYFVSFPYERHSSVGVNLHALHAIQRVPGYPDRTPVAERVVDYILGQQVERLYWVDKWHVSPYYATAHALACLGELGPDLQPRVGPASARAKEWLRQTQNADGSWGFYGVPTAEETAYGILGLGTGGWDDLGERDRRRCAAALRYLRLAPAPEEIPESQLPPLWIDKCLYTPTLVVRAAIEAATVGVARLGGQHHPTRPRQHRRRADAEHERNT
jgi:halimadienyl-diphosphate synthase